MISSDTIAAISTASGPAALSMIRVSGPRSLEVAAAVFKGKLAPSQMPSHTLHLGRIAGSKSLSADQAMLAVMKAPHSFTGEDLAEITCHGGAAAPQAVLQACLDAGARPARPGEFTLRAYLNGRLDLAQAEAVCDIINARTQTAAQAALERLEGGLSRKVGGIREQLLSLLALLEAWVDFPEEDIPPAEYLHIKEDLDQAIEKTKRLLDDSRASLILKDGARVVIAGRPNAGKSSLFNMLLKEERAIVAPSSGTTRDVLEGWIEIGGIPLRLFDTAGLRETGDAIELIGVERARGKMEQADLLLLVLDATSVLTGHDQKLLELTSGFNRIVLANKSDLPVELEVEKNWLKISSLTGNGLKELENAIVNALTGGHNWEAGAAGASNNRQMEALNQAAKFLSQARQGLEQKVSWEFLAQDIKEAVNSLGQITGQTIGDEVLNRIFEQFCIGK
ncbi:tRNA uridine-5-carboxymethylaminomethyl(34) synthesis GTPase MnmE [candidate division TA06 bacterium]|uniref:tRNA modification GTPase MnmE n=1 Tax=candidate division TA06 bacterium TaxID=2250710 RepID=A0A933MLM7_UNCT6|nr:tRNA uridine-5-carboxymethylaminomethyl(34) synthesis GTPase MnmE [candidate division TA06 bacterium]